MYSSPLPMYHQMPVPSPLPMMYSQIPIPLQSHPTVVSNWDPMWVSDPNVIMPSMASTMMANSYLARSYPRYHPQMIEQHPFMSPTLYAPTISYGMNQYRSIPLQIHNKE
jgi:hypothetical protein